ncbi:MAG TPA: RT0821/Lpp0805 family surface protein [Candidatus Binatia bacterium]
MRRTVEPRPVGGPTYSAAFKAITLAVLLVVIAACATGDIGTKTTVGGLGGAALGGLIAGAAGGGGAAIAAGVIGGALVGGLVGNMLDERDKRMAAQTQNRALETTPSGQSLAWNNPDSGHSGSVTPIRTYQAGGTYCREYQQTVTIGGKQEQSYGTACRQPDGSWKVS